MPQIDSPSGRQESRKRPRIDLERDSEPDSRDDTLMDHSLALVKYEEPKRDEKYWFDDGSVVLVAGDVAYRVHASILSRHSTVFRDMIQASKDTPSGFMDTCSMIWLSDTAMDVSVLLSVLYSGADSLGSFTKQVPFDIVASSIRMGHKYQMERLRDDALARLHSCFPDTLTDISWARFIECKSTLITMDVEDSITAVNLARLTDTPSILPTALYRCCVDVPSDTLAFGTRWADGVVDRLSTEDLSRCLQGIRALQEAKVAKSTWIFRVKDCDPHCKTRSTCMKSISALPKFAHKANHLATPNALDSLIPSGLCDICYVMIRTKDEEAIQGLFMELPTYMGVDVENWGE